MPKVVQEYIRKHGLQALTDNLAIKTKRHETYNNLVLCKYSQIDSPMGDPVVQHCRGIILDENNDWAVVSHGFSKFFNAGEGHAAEIDWSTARVYDKLDGSLACLFFYDEQWHVQSSGTPDGHAELQQSGKTFKEIFWGIWNERGYKLPDINSPAISCTFMFEMMSPENRVIVPHKDRNIVLTGCRDTDLNMEFDVNRIADMYNWDVVRSFDLTSLDDCIKAANELNPMRQEGFVVCDGNFNRIKIKSPQYVALHHMKDGFTKRRMLTLCLTNEESEFLQYFECYRPIYDSIANKVFVLIEDLEKQYTDIQHIESQKDFALEAVKSRLPSALFALRSGKVSSVREHLSKINIKVVESLLSSY